MLYSTLPLCVWRRFYGIGVILMGMSCISVPAYTAGVNISHPRTFEEYLAEGYSIIAGFEANDATDLIDSRVMSDRAVAAYQGIQVEPLRPEEVRLVRVEAETLAMERARLMRVLGDNAVVNASPKAVAQAQVAYDCWALHQQAEPNASHNLYSCERNFHRLMAALEPQLTVVAPVAARYDVVYMEDIFFEWDKSLLTPQARVQLDKLRARLREPESPARELSLQGFADRSGAAEYNQALSQRRVNAVAAYLGVDPADTVHVNLMAYGETHLPVSTADGVREPANRLTKVAIVKEEAQQ